MDDKMEEDFSSVVDTEIPKNTTLAKEGKLSQAIENLLSLEKQCRQGGDSSSTSRLLVTIITLCYEAKDMKALQHNISLLSKRRGQLKPAIKAMVKKAMEFLDHLSSQDELTLIETLIQVTQGKIFVEKLRARLTLRLAHKKEKAGEIVEAANTLQSIQVETFGAMKKREKTEFILEQMRLCLLKKDYIRTQIISRKIAKRVLDNEEFQDLKVQYYQYMVQYHMHDRNYLDASRAFFDIYNTKIVKEDEKKWKDALKHVLVYALLAPYDNEQSDLVARMSQDPKLEKIPEYHLFVKRFLTMELLPWTFVEEKYKELLKNDLPDIFGEGETSWRDLHQRVVEHNVRVIAEYYSRIEMNRLSNLLSLPLDKTEKVVCDLMVKKSIWAKIDRPAGVVSFQKRKAAEEILNSWASNISSVLSRVERINHLIDREMMVNK